ncbi:hypothetical protein [Amycolatopsis sp.]|uniref:hypothetical protein n=1 Tax=Amycolatopsis sp. TaxID=37632 RepID=UPI002625BD22|nr:hypothetical protein [Amycolatopsis sp.]
MRTSRAGLVMAIAVLAAAAVPTAAAAADDPLAHGLVGEGIEPPDGPLQDPAQ